MYLQRVFNMLNEERLSNSSPKPGAGGSSSSTPATFFLNRYNNLLALGVNAPGAIFLFGYIFSLQPLLHVT